MKQSGGPTKPFSLFHEDRPKRIARNLRLLIHSGESIMATIKTDTSSDEVWRAAQRRRAADIGAALRHADESAAPADLRRRLAIPIVLASLVLGIALWAVAGQPVHPEQDAGGCPARQSAVAGRDGGGRQPPHAMMTHRI
ncbi:MAG: hypothetical protein KGL35_21755 [Bradyrhizobium sp.]|uniref:hypothetical protein n=1 Tax=Bradyrhizobium sp. TaxID=376 RepID=UPI001C2844E3|nr:hypothetical protein [Bradyrhizobium sp.]MBU6462874.1 hypothetical protein [Pseudomonadota bacterium]MDE2066004.1 hypothetical protein [Bradyrhizobium sp.]MDE2471283.1 hypothetical protein [Bradyrhizobium sp.]